MFRYIERWGQRVRFDAQCDLAAVVYGSDDDPDGLLMDFADDLRNAGLRAVGVIQRGRSCRSQTPRLGVVMLPDGEAAELVRPAAICAAGCGLDPDRLTDVATRLAIAIEDGADLVIINRFGRAEAEGQGLIDLVALAVAADIPVLIAVPERRFADWIRFTDGMNVRLACRRDAVDRWWRSIIPTFGRRQTTAVTFCEIAK